MGFSEAFKSVGKSLDTRSVFVKNTYGRRADNGADDVTDFGSVFLDAVGEADKATAEAVNVTTGVIAGADISRLSAMSQIRTSCFDADFGDFDDAEELDDMIGFDEIEELDSITDKAAERRAVNGDNSIFFDMSMLPDIDVEEIG